MKQDKNSNTPSTLAHKLGSDYSKSGGDSQPARPSFIRGRHYGGMSSGDSRNAQNENGVVIKKGAYSGDTARALQTPTSDSLKQTKQVGNNNRFPPHMGQQPLPSQHYQTTSKQNYTLKARNGLLNASDQNSGGLNKQQKVTYSASNQHRERPPDSLMG